MSRKVCLSFGTAVLSERAVRTPNLRRETSRANLINATVLLFALVAASAVAQNTFPTNGNVGIGTTNPGLNGGPLTVGNTSLSSSYVEINSGSSSSAGNSQVRLYNGSAYMGGIVTAPFAFPGVLLVGNGEISFSVNSGYSSAAVISGSGNVGIGTTSPGAQLEVNGNVKLTSGSGASMTYADGTVQSTAWNGTTLGGDYAESIDVLGDRAKYEPGDVIVIDDSVTGKFNKSAEAYSKLVAGVYSTKPGLVGRRVTTDRPDKAAEVPMAMMGIVPTKVSIENGPIARGDLLVSSSIPGYAMKGTDRDRLTGAVIGKALAPLKSGTGVIEVLLALQ